MIGKYTYDLSKDILAIECQLLCISILPSFCSVRAPKIVSNSVRGARISGGVSGGHVETDHRHRSHRSLSVLSRGCGAYVEPRYGRIVNVTTIASKEGNANACAYSAAIAEVIALTNVPRQGTRNSRYRGELHTPAAAGMRIFDQMSQDHIDFMLSRIPRGRFLEVHEVSAMVTWLVLEENSFTTGAVFDLRGGRATY
jgi:NAD(P)-dependent dehydrogenase (short-subunit alcohol dehydrogenase family)